MRFGFIILFVLFFTRTFSQFADKTIYLVDSLNPKFIEDYDASILDSILKIYHKEERDTVKMNLLLYLTENLEAEEVWMPYNKLLLKNASAALQKKGLSVALTQYYKRMVAGAYNNNGFSYNQAGKKDKALESFLMSRTIMEELGVKEGLSDVYNNIGLIYKNIGQTSKALDYYFKCLRLCDETNDAKGKASSLNNIGMLYVDLQEYDKGLEYMTAALNEWEKLNNKRGMSSTLGNIGLIYDKMGKPDLSLKYYSNALILNEKSGDKEGIGTCLGNIGWIYLNQSMYSKAQNYFERSLMYRKMINDKAGTAYALYNLGTLYKRMNNPKTAKEYGDQALGMAVDLGYPDIIKRSAQLLYYIEKDNGNFKDALKMHELYITMRDSLTNEQSRKAGLKKQYQYEFDLKEAEYKLEQDKKDIMYNDELKRQKIIFIASLSGGIIFLLFSLILFQRFRVIRKQKEIIEGQKTEIASAFSALHIKNTEVMDSIYYARRIQNALLTSDDFFKHNFHNEHFILFKPKDIVSGDFYWATRKNNKFYLAVCDSTGHGVPGAFMSLLNIGFLSEAINEKNIEKPNEIFEYVRTRLIENVNKEGQKDGFDGTLVCFEEKSRSMTYASANAKSLIVRNHALIELKSDRMPVGIGERKETFTLFTQEIEKNDMLYLFTDGFSDQFGGPAGKKFKLKQLQSTLLSISGKEIKTQNAELLSVFENWKTWPQENQTRTEFEQIDDVCVFGLKLK